MGCACGKSLLETELERLLLEIRQTTSCVTENQVTTTFSVPKHYLLLRQNKPQLQLPAEKLCVFSKEIIELKTLEQQAQDRIRKGRGKSDDFQALVKEATSVVNHYVAIFQRDMQLVVNVTNRASSQLQNSKADLIELLNVLWLTQNYAFSHPARVNCIVVFINVAQKITVYFLKQTTSEFIETIESQNEMRELKIEVEYFKSLTQCCCDWIQHGKHLNALVLHFMTFKGFNEKLSWIDSFVRARMRLVNFVSDNSFKLSLNERMFSKCNSILDDCKRLSMSMENPLVEKALKFRQTFGERVLKMEHKNVKDMYQKSISGAGPFELDEVIKKCQHVAVELKSLYSLSDADPYMIEINEIEAKSVEVVVSQMCDVFPRLDDYGCDIDKNQYFRILEDAANAWQRLSRKVEKYKDRHFAALSIVDKLRNDALRKMLKYSHGYDDVDMLKYAIGFVSSLGLPPEDEAVQKAIAATEAIGVRQMKKAIKQCQKALIDHTGDCGFFESLAYFDDLSSKNNLILSWNTSAGGIFVDRFIHLLGEYELNGSFGGKPYYHNDKGDCISFLRNEGLWQLKSRNIVAYAKMTADEEIPPSSSWMAVDEEGTKLKRNMKKGEERLCGKLCVPLHNALVLGAKKIDLDQYSVSNGAIKFYNDLLESLQAADELGIDKHHKTRSEVKDCMFDIAVSAMRQLMDDVYDFMDANSATTQDNHLMNQIFHDFETDDEGNDDDDNNDNSMTKKGSNSQYISISYHLMLERARSIISYAKRVDMPLKNLVIKNIHMTSLISKIVSMIVSNLLNSCNDFVTAAGQDGLESVVALEFLEAKEFFDQEEKEKKRLQKNGEWLIRGDYEYIFIEKRMTYFGHKNNAKSHYGAKMVSITSEAEYKFVKDKVARNREILLGCVRHGRGNGKGAKHWKWDDGSSWKFEKWARGEPNNYGGRENRVHQWAHNGQWNDIHENHHTHSVYKRKTKKTTKTYRKAGRGIGSTPDLQLTAQFDQATIAALRKYLHFCGLHHGRYRYGIFDSLTEKALVKFFKKVNCYNPGEVFDCFVRFLRKQGIDLLHEEKEKNNSYLSFLFHKQCYVPARALQIFLNSSAADVNPFVPKHLLTCTLGTGAIDAYDLCIQNGRYYPMGKKHGKQIWRAANFSSFQYVEEEKKWNWVDWRNKIVCTAESSNDYPPLHGWKNVQENGPGDHVIIAYTELEEPMGQEEFYERSCITRLFRMIESAKSLVKKYNVKLSKDQEQKLTDTRHSIVKVVLRVAVESADKRVIDGALQLATKERLPKNSKDLLSAKSLKVALDVGVMMELKRQPTISINTIKKLTSPENLELEIRRREYLKNGDSIVCPQCKGSKDDNAACWMCLGSGNTSKAISELEAPKLDNVTCMICWDTAEYGLSTVCAHFYCSGCIKMTLKTALEMGQVPIYCPACKAAHTGKSGTLANVGRVEEEVLTFLARRNVIDVDMQFRIMIAERRKKDASEKGKEFFACPNDCGRYLIHEDKGSGEMQIVKGKEGHKIVFNMKKPGVCQCGCLVCVKCHVKLDPDTWKKHKCNQGGGKMDAKTLATLQKNAKKCPNCQAWVQKNAGCDTMMCGTNSHGSILQAIRNGGCGHQFHWSNLKPANTFYIGINGEKRSGTISKEYRLKAIQKVFGEQQKQN